MNPLFLNPWAILGAGVIAISLFIGGYWKGHHDASADGLVKIEALQLQASEAAQKQRQAELIQGSNASTGFENDNAKAETVFRTITEQVDRIVDRPVYLNACLDPDGLQLANAALGGIPTATPATEPNPAMPRPDTAH